MTSYRVAIPTELPGLTLKSGHDTMIVEASSTADAIAMAGGHYDGDSEGAWAQAVATAVAVASDLSPVVNAQGTTTSFKCWVRIKGGNGDAGPAYFEYVVPAAVGYDAAWTALGVLIAADADFPNAAWSGDLLTISDIGDNYGDHTVEAGFSYGGVDIPSFTSTIVHEGIAAAVLTVATNGSVVLAKVLSSAKS